MDDDRVAEQSLVPVVGEDLDTHVDLPVDCGVDGDVRAELLQGPHGAEHHRVTDGRDRAARRGSSVVAASVVVVDGAVTGATGTSDGSTVEVVVDVVGGAVVRGGWLFSSAVTSPIAT